MAKATGHSHMTISRIWQAFGLQPHRSESFKLSPDPLLVPKVRDIVGLVHEPAGTRGGAVRGRKVADSGAGSHGAVAADEARTSRAAHPHHRHRSIEFRKFLDRIAAFGPALCRS